MDVCFELMVLEDRIIRTLEMRQKTIIWGGVAYPQNSKCYVWSKYINLRESPVTPHILNYLPVNFRIQKWFCFRIQGQVLDLLESEVNGLSIDWENKTLDSLFKWLLSPQNMWVVIFEWQCDRIDRVSTFDIDSCLSLLRNNLKYQTTRQGFIVLSP